MISTVVLSVIGFAAGCNWMSHCDIVVLKIICFPTASGVSRRHAL